MQYDAELGIVTFLPAIKKLIVQGKFCFSDDFSLNFHLESDVIGANTASFDFEVEASEELNPNITFYNLDGKYTV